jgi:vancomycin resistance protein VanW
MHARSLVRRFIPFEVRLRLTVARRRWRERRVAFAARRASPGDFTVEVCAYGRRFMDYAGQETLAAAKRQNQRVLAAQLHGVVIHPGETFSVWRLAARPRARDGYAEAAALKDGVLTAETGGAICLLSTVLYNLALLSGMHIVERHCHSVDSYGDRRYFELGRDAAIEYGYLDLQFKNRHSAALMICFDIDDAGVFGSVRGPSPLPCRVEFDISAPEPVADEAGFRRDGMHRFRVRTQRLLHWPNGREAREDLGFSTYRIPPGGR